MTSAPLQPDSRCFMTECLGPAGIAAAEVHALSYRLDGLRGRLNAWHTNQTPSFFGLPGTTDWQAIHTRAQRLQKQFRQMVVFGIGGSSLGGEMLCRLLGAPGKVRFFDNIDPTSLFELERVDWKDTCLLVVSKSGSTAETLCQILSLLPTLESTLGAEGIRRHVFVITEDPSSPLGELATRLQLEILPHPPVGGRYSVLSIVGLLPAAFAGADIAAILNGARAMAQRCLLPDMDRNPAFWNGGCQYLHAMRGRTLSVQMSYSDRLPPIMRWFRQLWAESLGKRDQDGRPRGLTPIEAFGVTDQHSQLQLYLEGPDDKQFTFLTTPMLHEGGSHVRIPERFTDVPALAALAGHTMGELFSAEFEAIRTTLSRHGRPHRTIQLAANDAHAVGELILLLETETVVVAELFGVDPFDQPAVEGGKRLAREYLQKFRR